MLCVTLLKHILLRAVILRAGSCQEYVTHYDGRAQTFSLTPSNISILDFKRKIQTRTSSLALYYLS